jgi:pheromone a factor receptor
MALASTQVLFSLPFSLFGIISWLRTAPIQPWISWADTHQHLGQVNLIPYEALAARPRLRFLMDLSRWTVLCNPFLFFMNFGLSGEARKEYKRMFWWTVALLGIKPPATRPETSRL